MLAVRRIVSSSSFRDRDSSRSWLVLVRHGQSTWNESDRFTGWWDADLTIRGEAEARLVGRRLADAGVWPEVVHTSVLTRAVRTANLALDSIDRAWIPVRRHWRLNERHYGDLTGLNKEETRIAHGDAQFFAWRRSFDVRPPPIRDENPCNPNVDSRYRLLPPELIPATECLGDVLERLLPYWYDRIVPDLQTAGVVLVVAHGNSLRALCKHLDQIDDEEIRYLEIPMGVPLIYELGADMTPTRTEPTERRLLGGDAED